MSRVYINRFQIHLFVLLLHSFPCESIFGERSFGNLGKIKEKSVVLIEFQVIYTQFTPNGFQFALGDTISMPLLVSPRSRIRLNQSVLKAGISNAHAFRAVKAQSNELA